MLPKTALISAGRPSLKQFHILPLASIVSGSNVGLGLSLRHDGWFDAADMSLAVLQLFTSRSRLS